MKVIHKINLIFPYRFLRKLETCLPETNHAFILLNFCSIENFFYCLQFTLKAEKYLSSKSFSPFWLKRRLMQKLTEQKSPTEKLI